jgi:aerobic carbon-monoxide dehydrogenase medium subunit
VKPARFAYARPETLGEALALLTKYGSDASILAGGQSLMPMLNLRMATPAILIDINDIPDLDTIADCNNQIIVGARVRHNDALHSPLLTASNSLLAHALPRVAHAAIRNRGTLGGSLALADPAAELPACAVCLGAEIAAVSERGERVIPASDFFQGLYATALEPDEMITRVAFPFLDATWHVGFDEVARRSGDFAIAALALAVKVVDRRIMECRIAFAGVENHARRLSRVEMALTGSLIADLPVRGAASEMLSNVLEPLEEGQYPAAYRRHLAQVLLDRLLTRIRRRVHT